MILLYICSSQQMLYSGEKKLPCFHENQSMIPFIIVLVSITKETKDFSYKLLQKHNEPIIDKHHMLRAYEVMLPMKSDVNSVKKDL